MSNINAPLTDQNAALEQFLIDEYLDSRGHTRQSIRQLNDADALSLLRAAADYGSLRLALIEFRAHYIDRIHHVTG